VLCVAAKFGLDARALAEAAKCVPPSAAPRRDGRCGADAAPGVVLAARDRGDAS
jgi:hypothetical protein